MEADGLGERPNAGKDAWGTYYRFTRTGADYQIRCAGPDKEWETVDDVLFTGRLETHDPRRTLDTKPRKPEEPEDPEEPEEDDPPEDDEDDEDDEEFYLY